VLAIQDDSNTPPPLLVAMADYAAAFPVSGQAAIQSARHCLIDALARGFEALRDPQCAALVGPIVPGAVMPGGARVPGTSLELEPAQAAFCISLMLCRPAGGERWAAPGGARAADCLGAILATADYQARKALMEGKPPPKVRDVLAALLKALEVQGVLAALDEDCAASGSPLRLARVAATAIAAAQLGAAQGQIIRAVGYACIDAERHTMSRNERAWADGIGRAVRHACQALASGTPIVLTGADLEVVSLAGRVLTATRGPLKKPFGTAHIDRLIGLQKPQEAVELTARFRAAVDRSFPTRQAERVKALFATPERLDDLPVNELIAALVTNGAR
jgi:hypothetical protein